MTAPRIAIAGFQHETNTFAPSRAGWAEFQMADSWPPLLVGEDTVSRTKGMNLPIAGAAAEAEAQGFDIIPILWCAAEPSGHVTDDAFERISGMILDGIAGAGALDGIYLDLHGAMVTDTYDDGEAALLRLVRDHVGPDMPIWVSLDLHANLSPALVELATGITIYRTYPHLDMADTGARAMRGMASTLAGMRLASSFREVPFLLPLHAQSTELEPCRELYEEAKALSKTPGEHVEVALGFTAADVSICGPSVVAYAASQARADDLSDQMLSAICASEPLFQTNLLTPSDAIAQARALDGPVTLADVQDNPGAGGSSDTTGVLRAMLDADVRNGLVGIVCDPDMAAMAHQAGEGAVVTGSLGGKSGLADDQPIVGEFEVLHVSDGSIEYTGEMYGGGVAELGPSCLLAIGGTRVVVSSTRVQCLDLALFRHFGVEPTEADIVSVKSTVHFQADFAPISSAILNVASPGHFPCDLSSIPYKKVTRRLLRNGS
ncbi:MAG: M81 family metallopeptidase [Boseongicola sp.]|nr:M81 family metallopeptidase [Boseongicola sp.]